tara:strand:+ start:10323 stop:10937 length:615 start_codon:yes stop_codon:yes gene_type:complete
MLKVNLDNELKKFKKDLKRVEKRGVPDVAILAINDTLALVKAGEQLEMKQKLENPTNFTLNSLKIFKANYKTPTPKGRIFIFKNQEKYLKFQIDGGTDIATKGRFAVPIDRSLKNQFGNLRRGKRRLFRTKKDFYADINGTAGIWQNTGGDNIKLRIAFTDKRTYTKKPFDFYGRGKRIINTHFNKRMKIHQGVIQKYLKGTIR